MQPPAASAAGREAALEFLFSRVNYERTSAIPYDNVDFKLDRMRGLLTLVGEPQTGMPIVHVAGTKGKGSTSAMIAAILSAAGLRTGLYSSPHLDRVEERIAVDGAPISGAALAELVERVRPAVALLDQQASEENPAASGPTYFEIITAMAMLRFAAAGCQAAVLEVGLGGRLDSTNFCQPAVAVITSISYDHMRQLGATLSAIATEKAGIIKPGAPVVSGVLTAEPREVIATIAAERGAPLRQLGRDYFFAYEPPKRLELADAPGKLTFRTADLELKQLELSLLGQHQAANAAVALETIAELRRQGWSIPEAAIRQGLSAARWPARVEVISRQPTVVLDAAHNGASIAALLLALDESFSPGPRILIFATTREKDVVAMLVELLPKFDAILFTRYQHNPRSVPPEELAVAADDLIAAFRVPATHYEIAPDPTTAWRRARELATPAHLIAITGSFFIASEMRAVIDAATLSSPARDAGM